MRWFRRAVPLPAASYGYRPPRGAPARGWECNAAGCGASDTLAPADWPHPCPLCGHPTDPLLDEPWHEESRGPRLRMFITRDGDTHGFFATGLLAWRYRQALTVGDRAGAAAVRSVLRGTLTDVTPGARASALLSVTSTALAFGDGDAAAAEIVAWFDRHGGDDVDVEGVESDHDRRTELRSLLSVALGFLADPQARRHPDAALVDARTRRLAVGLTDVLTAEQLVTLRRLARTPAPISREGGRDG